ncbi:MAG: chemotaxis protein CheW, partial [Gammaproteobacteria bacterium]|nr:chemotaxis protein CheW [Gammaproteobacteria bacterium]
MQNTAQNKLLLFQVGPVKCSLFSNDIQTIIPPPKHETAGKTGRLPGIFRHNERIVRVVDVRTKFGLSPSDPTQGRVIIAELDKGSYAFWVDKVINVIDQEDGRWDVLPAALPREVFTSTFIMGKELILHTECARLEAMVPSAGLRQHIEQLEAQIQTRPLATGTASPSTSINREEPKQAAKSTEQPSAPAAPAATVTPKSVATAAPAPSAAQTSPTTRITPPARPTTPTTPVPGMSRPVVTPAPITKRVT